MNYLKRTGARIATAFILLGLFMGGVWVFDRFDGNSDTAAMKPGECFLMTDGPTRGSGGEETDLAIDTEAEEEYPTVNCDDWSSQEKPWLVYRVEWVKEANDENGTRLELEESCPDLYIYDATSVTCLANMELENS